MGCYMALAREDENVSIRVLMVQKTTEVAEESLFSRVAISTNFFPDFDMYKLPDS